jgi:hypothetical protein
MGLSLAADCRVPTALHKSFAVPWSTRREEINRYRWGLELVDVARHSTVESAGCAAEKYGGCLTGDGGSILVRFQAPAAGRFFIVGDWDGK